MSNDYEVEIDLVIPFKVKARAKDEAQAYDKAGDDTMEFLEARLGNSRDFDQFWEYEVQLSHKSCIVSKS